MFEFRDRVVYIISPEQWGAMKISKHHYAMELAHRNCKVFFIEPPSLSYRGVSVRDCKDHPGISLVSYKPVFRGKRFLPRSVYSSLLRLQARLLLRAIGAKPDAVLCFHGYLFEDLRFFKAPVRIFFAADFFGHDHLPPEISTANFSMAVSDTIHARISEWGHTVHKVNHGVSKVFAQAAEGRLREGDSGPPTGRLTVGYVGNLRMEAMDRITMMSVIGDNPDILFVFWGSYKPGELNLGGLQSEEVDAFIRFLTQSPNVELRGPLDTATLQREMSRADLFWMCLKIGAKRMWDGSNSHKILEYLSTGKPVVSHMVSSYKGTGLLYMMDTADNGGYAGLFREVVARVRAGEDRTLVEKRLREVVSNTYSNHISRMEQIIRESAQ